MLRGFNNQFKACDQGLNLGEKKRHNYVFEEGILDLIWDL